MTATQPLNAYPAAAAVKTLETAVNHDQCSNTMKPLLAFADEAGKYKRCCSSLAITPPTTSDFPVFVEEKESELVQR